MFKIGKIEKESFYIDIAMKAMQEYATKERDNIDKRYERNVGTKKKTSDEIKLNKRKDLELEKIRVLNEKVNLILKSIIKRFPNFQKVDDIYIKLINTSQTSVETIKDALARLLWIVNTVDEFTQNTQFKIKKVKTQETTGFLMKKYLGRVNSLFRKNKKFFEILDEARKFMNSIPTFMDMYTISIAGFPNVGKSTLMKKLTGSNVEIQNYPFTTKGLMFGYLNIAGTKAVQLIDTPGLLGREKTNEIEQRAQVVIQQFCSEIIFVLDFTQNCGYEIEAQLKLLKKTIHTINKPVALYLSKKDIFDEEARELYEENKNKLKKYTIFTESEKLKKYILENYTKSLKKFDPKKINLIK